MRRGLILLLLTLATKAADLPVVIAHRGASGYLPEHTAEAKVLAHAMGADLIEQDLVLSADNVPVVLHDIHLDTVTDAAARFPDRKRADGRCYALDFTVAELRTLRVTERIDPKSGAAAMPRRFPAGTGSFRIATLDDELSLLAGLARTTGRRAGICPELKQPAWHRREGRDLAAAVLPVLRRHGFVTKKDPCWIQCFEAAEIRRLRTDLGWQGRLVQLAAAGDRALLADDGLRAIAAVADAIGPSLDAVITGSSPEDRVVTDLCRRARACGLSVFPWTVRADALPRTVRSLDELHDLLFREAGASGCFTDFPDLTLTWLKRQRQD